MTDEEGAGFRPSRREVEDGRLRRVTGDPEGPGGMKKPPGPGLRGVAEGIAEELEAGGVENARREAERLLCHALGMERHELALDEGGKRLGAAEAGRLARAVRRRLKGEPLQHIEGSVHFRDLVLLCDRRALVPRPETEQLVERVVQWARRRRREGSLPPDRREDGPPLESVLDVGVGSGAIALSLLHEGIAERAVGVDVSREALMLAGQNREKCAVDPDRLELRLVSRPLWNSVAASERFDAVVSNPPYVSDEELEGLAPEVADHEPRVALAGGEDGLEVIREIADRAARYLEEGGALFLEIGAGQADAVRGLLEGSPEWGDVRVTRDLAGRDRFVRALTA